MYERLVSRRIDKPVQMPQHAATAITRPELDDPPTQRRIAGGVVDDARDATTPTEHDHPTDEEERADDHPSDAFGSEQPARHPERPKSWWRR